LKKANQEEEQSDAILKLGVSWC